MGMDKLCKNIFLTDLLYSRWHLCGCEAWVGGSARVRSPGQVRVHSARGDRFWLRGSGGPRGGGGANTHPPRHQWPGPAAPDAHGLRCGQTRPGKRNNNKHMYYYISQLYELWPSRTLLWNQQKTFVLTFKLYEKLLLVVWSLKHFLETKIFTKFQSQPHLLQQAAMCPYTQKSGW